MKGDAAFVRWAAGERKTKTTNDATSSLPQGTALGLGFALAVALRVAAWNLHLSLPTWLKTPSAADRRTGGLTRFFQQ